MGPDEVVMRIDKVECMLELAPVLGEPQGLTGQTTEFLADEPQAHNGDAIKRLAASLVHPSAKL